MAVDLLKEYIKLNKLTFGTESQAVFESDIIVPDVKPDIREILLVDGEVCVDSVENFRDKLNVNFTIQYKILYRSKNSSPMVTPIHYHAKFTSTINVDSLDADSNITVRCDMEHIDYSLLNDRKINTKAIVTFIVQANSMKEVGLASDITGKDGVQMRKKAYPISNCIDTVREKCTVSETVNVPGVKPSIQEVLRTDTALLGKSVKVMDGALIVKGELAVTTMYLAADETNSIQYMESSIPFSLATEVFVPETANPDTTVCLDNFQSSVTEDSDGELRCLVVNAEISVTASFYENKEIAVLDDAYCLDSDLKISRETFQTASFLGDIQNQFVLKEIVKKSDYAPDMLEIMHVSCKAGKPESYVENSRIVLEGYVKCTFLYLSGEDCPVASFSKEIPYKYVFDKKDVPEDATLSVKADVEHINFSLVSNEEAEIRIVICACASLTRCSEIPIISKVAEASLSADNLATRPSVVLYFVRSGDSLWSIAKKYMTTCDILCAFNELDEKSVLMPGMQLVIPK